MVVVTIIFCYIFSFYIIPPITSSILVGFLCILFCIRNKEYTIWLLQICKNNLIGTLFLFQLLLIGINVAYFVLHFTFDMSYLKILIGHIVHFIFGIFILIYLRYKLHITSLQIEKIIVYAYVVQSLIELIGFGNQTFATLIGKFTGDIEFQEKTGGVRGLALSSATGWSLALSYGIVYIVYVKRFLLRSSSLFTLLIGALLFVGTFFAGRTGFVGAGISFLYFMISSERNARFKLSVIIKLIGILVSICLLFYFLLPEFSTLMVEDVFPFAFEPFYKLYYGDEFSTGSTDRLGEMWDTAISLKSILVGDGYFTDPTDGAYYKHLDIGLMRNLFYWGILGYLFLIWYQITIIKYIRNSCLNFKKIGLNTLYQWMLLLFLCVMELKAVSIGINKMTFSILFLLAYFYYNDNNGYFFNAQKN